jgi:hypothetical protein
VAQAEAYATQRRTSRYQNRAAMLQSRHINAVYRLPLTLALSAALAGIAPAQTATTPDFSGTWKLNLAKSKLDKHNTIASETITITSKEGTIEFHYITDGKEQTHSYIADGKERRLAEVQGGYVVQKATWKKAALVIEQSGRSGPSPGFGGTELWLTGERWTLSGDGHTLTLDSKGFDSQRRTFVYDKQ